MSFLNGVRTRAGMVEPDLGQRIAGSVDAAMAWCREIKPAMCEHYIEIWRQDLDVWEQRLKSVPTGLSAEAALGKLDLCPYPAVPALLN